jgi:hypothetical protein
VAPPTRCWCYCWRWCWCCVQRPAPSAALTAPVAVSEAKAGGASDDLLPVGSCGCGVGSGGGGAPGRGGGAAGSTACCKRTVCQQITTQQQVWVSSETGVSLVAFVGGVLRQLCVRAETAAGQVVLQATPTHWLEGHGSMIRRAQGWKRRNTATYCMQSIPCGDHQQAAYPTTQ